MNIYVAFRDKQENEKVNVNQLQVFINRHVTKIKDIYNNEMSMLFNN
jgi:hypothetical protein